MASREILAKTLLTRISHADSWFGATHNIKLHRGCQYCCIYCDTRSECYQVDTFDSELLIKANAAELLRSRYEERYGGAYYCVCPRSEELGRLISGLYARLSISEGLNRAADPKPKQLSLFQGTPD